MKCLIVDPSPLSRRGLKHYLLSHGCDEVLETASGAEGLDLCKEGIDLVMTSWTTSTIDGLELARTLRAEPKTQAARIVMVTPRNGDSDVRAAREAGIDAYLLKPLDVEALDRKIDLLLAEPSEEETAQKQAA